MEWDGFLLGGGGGGIVRRWDLGSSEWVDGGWMDGGLFRDERWEIVVFFSRYGDG